MNTYIIGAGAMGSLFAGKLADGGVQITMVDEWEPQIQAIKANGLKGKIGEETLTAPVKIIRPEEANEPADLIVIFVKSMQLEHYLQRIKSIITPDTAVVCLLNGIGHEMILQKYLPHTSIFMGVTIWAAGLDSPGVFHSGASGNIELQNFVDNDEAEKKARSIIDLLNRGGLNAVYSKNVKFSIWRKACVNGTSNTLCTLLEKNVGQLNASEHHNNLLRPIIEEFCQAAAYQGVDLPVDEMMTYLDKILHSPSVQNHFPSMYQDLIIAKRITEIDYLNGAVAKILQAHGQEAPVCQLLTELIHTKEDLLINMK